MSDLDWRNAHGIGFGGSKMEDTRENKVKVLNQIRKGDVTVEDSEMACFVIHVHKYDDYVDVFYSEDNPQSALNQMEESLMVARGDLPPQFHSNLPLSSSLELCREIYEPDLPDINSDWDVLAYCV